MKNNKRNKVIISVTGLFLVIAVIWFTKCTTYFDKDIVAVSFNKFGGFAGTKDRFIVFQDHGAYYYTDMSNVYTIPKDEFEKFISNTQKLHLEDINGYNKTTSACDAYYNVFCILYDDGTMSTGATYNAEFPKQHNAKLLREYSEDITSKDICNYEFDINDTYHDIHIVFKRQNFYYSIDLRFAENGENVVSLSLPYNFRDDLKLDQRYDNIKISQTKYNEIRKMTLDVFQSLSKGPAECSYITMRSPVYGEIKKFDISQSGDVMTLVNKVIDLILPETR